MAAVNNTGMSRVPVAGAPVFTRDGARIGEVKEVANGSFKVDASGKPDYWLSAEFVTSSNPAQVELDFDSELLDEYKLDGPGPALAESPILNDQAETFSSPEEKEARREAMEHGYGRHTGGDSIN